MNRQQITIRYYVERFHAGTQDEIGTPADLPEVGDIVQMFTGMANYLVKKITHNEAKTIYQVWVLPHDEQSARTFFDNYRRQPQNLEVYAK